MMKYQLPGDQGEVLPNLFGLNTPEEIALSEFEGFLKAEILLTEKFLPQTMQAFEQEILDRLPNRYENRNDLIQNIAVVHAELLFIHPFREGNGRTARILANLMARKQGYGSLLFEKVGEREFEFYVSAVQQAAAKKYTKMIEFISAIFPK
jgi:cell filamentation protein